MGRYEIISADGIQHLIVYVDQYVRAGWIPSGGPVRDGSTWYQAVYWREE